MDASERRRTLIELLRQETADARAELARRRQELEADPAKMQDRLMAEHRERVGAAYMRKSEPDGLMYRDSPENQPAPVTPADSAPFTEEQTDVALPFTELQLDCLNAVVKDLRAEWRNEIIRLKKEFASYRREWRFERRILNDQIAVLRKKINLDDARATIVDLPRGFIRRRNDDAA
jgi:hypothetical protein